MNRSLRLLLALATVAILLTSASTALAHYLWIGFDAKPEPHGVANIYFEEGPWAGDGKYLDPFLKDGKVWLRTIADPEPRQLETREVKQGDKLRWMASNLSAAGPRCVDSYGKFGVYTYPNKTDVLLYYYAKGFDVDSGDELRQLARAKELDLDLVPNLDGDTLKLQLLWHGKPQPERTVYIRGPKKLNLRPKTDEQGNVSFKAEHAGMYLLRSSVEMKVSGRDGGDEYEIIRHQVTISLQLPLK